MSWSGWNLPPGCYDRHIDEAAPRYWDPDRPVRCEQCGIEWAREEINMGPWCAAEGCPMFDGGSPVEYIEDMEDVPNGSSPSNYRKLGVLVPHLRSTASQV